MRELLTVKNDSKGILKTPCKPVKTINSAVNSVAQDLSAYMFTHREDEVAPIGLAASQLGELTRVIAFYPNPIFRERDGIEVLINPELIKARKFILLTETCLSIPEKIYVVRRAKIIKVKGLTLNGRPKSYKAAGLFAQCLQHEIDHLNGVLIDSIGKLVRRQ